MTKKCMICGKEFEPNIHVGDRQVCCSKECSYKRNLAYNIRYSIERNKRNKAMGIGQSKVKCMYCGEHVPNIYTEHGYGKLRYHEECMIKDCITAFNQFGKLPNIQKRRLYGRGYTIAEFKEEYGEYLCQR